MLELLLLLVAEEAEGSESKLKVIRDSHKRSYFEELVSGGTWCTSHVVLC
jgi:hypothetical protein